MPVAVRDRVSALVEDAGNQASVARLLGVDRSRVTRWLRTDQQPDADNRRAIDALEFVLSRLRSRYSSQTAFKWLEGVNPQLAGARPIDLLRHGRVSEVVAALEADETGSFA
ncbi:MAG: hypothetical protein M3253_01530 [Chloroflexota bacterium]|nr:hypothetical protein [Chloroflexota bacterium]